MFAILDKVRSLFVDLSFHPLELAKDGSNSFLFCAIVSPAEQKSFCRNMAGFLRNDIDQFIHMEDQKVAQSLLSRLEEIPQKGFPSDENPDVIRMSMMSKYQQTAGEVTEWLEGQLEQRELEAERVRLANDEKLSDEQRDQALKDFKERLSNEDRDLWFNERRKREIEKMVEEEQALKSKKK